MKVVNIEEIRDKFACGDERSIMDFLLLQLLTNPGQDMGSILPILLLADTGRHGRGSKMTLIISALLPSQQQAQAAANAGTVPVPTTTGNIMPILAALLLRDVEHDDREVIVRPIRGKTRAVREYEVEEGIEPGEHVEGAEERRAARKK